MPSQPTVTLSSPPEPVDIAVIVVGLNASRYVRECFSSLEQATWREHTHEVIYVDNGSTDDTLSMIAMHFPAVRVIANPSNVGFCKAANQGARSANARHLFFLNDDTLVLDDSIALLVEHADQHPSLGCVGGRLLNTDGTEQFSGRRFPSPWNAIFGRRSWLTRLFPNAPAARDYCYKRELAIGKPFRADWVSAAAVLFPASFFLSVGGFAEDFYYWHEVVISDRVRAAGYEVELLPAARIIHHEGKGSGPRPFPVQRRHILDFHRGAFRCFCQHSALSVWHPLRLATAALLASRAAALLVVAAIRSSVYSVRPAQLEVAS